MNVISTKVHGVLDYLVGFVLILFPWIFDLSRDSAAYWVPLLLGCATILFSLLTRYELGLVKVISMPMHLIFDFLGAMLLAASPWLFEFHNTIYRPHLWIGLGEIVFVFFSSSTPGSVTPRRNNTSRKP